MLSQPRPLSCRVFNRVLSSADHVLDSISGRGCVGAWILEEDGRPFYIPLSVSRIIRKGLGNVVCDELPTADCSLPKCLIVKLPWTSMSGGGFPDLDCPLAVIMFDILFTRLSWTHEASCIFVEIVKRGEQYFGSL